MSSCGKSLTSTSSMHILDQGSTIPAPVDYEGILKMEGASGLQSTDSTQASTFEFRFRPDNVDVQIIDPLVGAASCQDLRGEGSASSQGDRRCGSRCGRRPPRPLRPPRTGGERNQMIVNMMIVLELECLVSRQWQGQIRGFQPGQPAGCSWKKIFGCRNIQEYQVI